MSTQKSGEPSTPRSSPRPWLRYTLSACSMAVLFHLAYSDVRPYTFDTLSAIALTSAILAAILGIAGTVGFIVTRPRVLRERRRKENCREATKSTSTGDDGSAGGP